MNTLTATESHQLSELVLGKLSEEHLEALRREILRRDIDAPQPHLDWVDEQLAQLRQAAEAEPSIETVGDVLGADAADEQRLTIVTAYANTRAALGDAFFTRLLDLEDEEA